MAEHDDEIIWPTQVRRRLAAGICVGVDKSVWLIRSVPMSPVTDANSEMDALSAAIPLYQAFGEIAQVTPLGAVKRRRAVRGAYREVHLLLINIPRTFSPPRDHPNYAYMRDQFGKEIVQERVLLLAVKLRDKTLSSGGVRAAVDFVAETLLTGQVPIAAYEQDKALIGSALARAGLSVPTEEQLRVAEHWWTLGDYPDVPSVAHSDHMHFFDSPAAARSAADAGLEDCTKWPSSDSYAITFASVADFDLPFVSPVSDAAQWVVPLLNENALAISIRARIEPAIVTQGELKRQSKRYLDDMIDRANKNKDTDYDQIEQKSKIDALRDSYSLSGAAPVLTETSILVAFNRRRDINNTRISNTLDLRAMSYRHQLALSETMLCSPTRANPYLHDLPAETVACSGIVSRTIVGDQTGVLVGFTELDRQPAWLDTKETGRLSSPPTCVVVGSSGSGKLIKLSTPIPTPSGWTTMGDLRVGDTIFGGDGKPCTVTFKTDINERPDLYAVTFSDGQVVYADYDHQWLVSSAADRKAVKTTKRATAIVNWDDSRQVINDLWRLADQYSDDDELTVKQISEAIIGAGIPGYWAPLNLRASLSIMDAPSRTKNRTIVQQHVARTVVTEQQVALVPAQHTLLLMADAWAGSRRQRSTVNNPTLAQAARTLAAEAGDQTTVTVRDLVRMFARKGVPLTRQAVKHKIVSLGVDFEHTTRSVPAERGPRTDVFARPVLVFSARIAFKALAERISQSYGPRPFDTVQQRRLTTGEMLAEGIHTQNVRDEANFHVNVPDAIELPEAALDVDPYVLGAWLGDGGTSSGMITQGVAGVCTDSNLLTDQAFLMGQLLDAGYPSHVIASSEKTVSVPGLMKALHTAGVLTQKHIPMASLRSSAAQRLALLQGLMDTDGTIDEKGGCELTLCDKRLADGALELIRSLGIKCSMTSSPAAITEADPDRLGHKRRRVTGTRYRMHFTTTTPVFRLPRKAARLPQSVRETQKRLYIKSIEPVATEPGACITVDSLDHTYLVEGFVKTANTQLLQHLATQLARSGRPALIFDPKALALDTRIPVPSGWSTVGDIQPGDRLFSRDGSICTVVDKSRVFPASQTRLYEFAFDDGQVIRADANHQWVTYDNQDRERYVDATPEQIAQWAPSHHEWARQAATLAANTSDSESVSTYGLLLYMQEHGIRKWNEAKHLGEALRAEGVVPMEARKLRTWPAAVALKAVANFLERTADAPFGRVLTTDQMLARGVERCGQSRWAIPTQTGIDCPDAELPIDPYLLGVWLGDGTAANNSVACGDEDIEAMLHNIRQVWPNVISVPVVGKTGSKHRIVCGRDFEVCLYGHRDYADRSKNDRAGGTQRYCATCAREYQRLYKRGALDERGIVNPPLHHLLRDTGLLGDKHIPAAYLRASRAQRLALLQGLMDTDGTVKRRGDLRLTMTNKKLTEEIRDLVRGLGFKAKLWEGRAAITEPDPANPGPKRLRVIGREWVISFRTSETVFRLPRKIAAQPREDSFRSQFYYVTTIREIEPDDAQCLIVDSADHTYLVGDYLATHNSSSDLSPTVLGAGGQVSSLDDLVSSDGAFDPLRFMERPEDGIQLASSVLSNINVWGTRRADFEASISVALRYGVERGAVCTGQALDLAMKGGVVPAEIVEPVLRLAKANPMMGACVGRDPNVTFNLRFEGLTLIKVGKLAVELPEEGTPLAASSIDQRIGASLIRLVIYGGAAAVSGRGGGGLFVDEAWIVFQNGLSELTRLARLARSQDVVPFLFTQKISDISNADFEQHLSRVILLHMDSRAEALAACGLTGMEPTEDRIDRLLARAEVSGTGGAAMNWNSLQALINPDGTARRGAVGIYCDVRRRNVPVEIKLNEDFLRLSTSRPEDIARRKAEEAHALASLQPGDSVPASR